MKVYPRRAARILYELAPFAQFLGKSGDISLNYEIRIAAISNMAVKFNR